MVILDVPGMAHDKGVQFTHLFLRAVKAPAITGHEWTQPPAVQGLSSLIFHTELSMALELQGLSSLIYHTDLSKALQLLGLS